MSSSASLPTELDQKVVEFPAEDLPLRCPLPSQKLWNTHPRVYLPIEAAADREIRCPYCSTLYRLVGEVKAGH